MDTEKLAEAKTIRECAICGLITDQSIVVCPEDGSALLTHRPDPFVGTVLDERFEILSLIGAGGMGNVYKARQLEIDRLVAIKFLHGDKLHQLTTLKRFMREAKAAASLSHPNIVGFFDFGVTRTTEQPYIIMDYVEGQPLDQLLQNGPLPYQRCLPLFMQVCEALQHAHDKGIVHRDIKPSNIMLITLDDGKESVKVLDFGVAKLLPRGDNNEPQQQNLTQTGELFGSPQYMSPEQWAGQVLDLRSDMYSFGCVMYETLIGRPPISGVSIVETIHAHTHVVPPSFKSVRPDLYIPEQLEAVIFKTLEKAPDERFESMAVLKRNLEFVPQFAEAEKKLPPASQPPQRPQNTNNHNSSRAATSATTNGDTGNTSAKSQSLPPNRANRLLIGGAVIAAAAVAAFIFCTEYAPEWFSALRMPLYERTYGDKSMRLVPMLERLAVQALYAGNDQEALAHARRAIAIVKHNNGESWALADENIRLANMVKDKAPFMCKQFLGDGLSILRHLADINRTSGHFAANIDPQQAIDRTIGELNHQLHSGDGNNRSANQDTLEYASDLLQNNQVTDADSLLQQLINEHKDLDQAGQLKLADALAQLAGKQAEAGDETVALESYKKAIQMKTKLIGAQTEPVAELQTRMGMLLQKRSRFNEAEEVLLDALENSQAASTASGGNSEQAAGILEKLGNLYVAMNSNEKADGMFKLARDMREKLPPVPSGAGNANVPPNP